MKTYNFSAGPAVLDNSVLKVASNCVIDYAQSGMSVLEMSHRSGPIVSLFEEATNRTIDLLNIPKGYSVLWLQGGASLQFSMVPMNLLPDGCSADYIVTGLWSLKAVQECNKIGKANVIASSQDNYFNYIPKEYSQNSDSKYLHITSNNTIYGTQYKQFPKVRNDMGFLVADMSSDILSKPINISEFGLIYAGAQKNMGPAGVTLIIIRDDILDNGKRDLATMLDYRTHIKKASMFNTPPFFSVFVINETLKWIEKIGGLEKIAEKNRIKAEKLYHEIKRNNIFICPIAKEDRSLMNVPFTFSDKSLNDNDFLEFCKKRNLYSLKGHRSVGGFRASIYNAMPEDGIDALVNAMHDFENNLD